MVATTACTCDKQYAYYLEGLEESWIDAGHTHQAFYTNLDPKDYVFHARLLKQPGAELRLPFSIRPVFYTTWWFKSMVALLLLGLLAFIYRSRMSYRMVKAELKLEEATLRQKEANHNEELAAYQLRLSRTEICSLTMRTIIIDDEPDNVELLAMQLARHCPQVDIVGQYTDSPTALAALQTLRPALVFLDIEMPMLNGFQLLEQLGEIPFQVVFVTAYNQYAVRAFRFAALDYLLKPVDTADLINTVRRAEQAGLTANQTVATQLDLLRAWYPAGLTTNAPAGNLPTKMALPHANGLTFVETSQILYAESDSNYTNFVLANGEKYLVSKTLGDVQEMLECRNFLRVHRQHVVNLDHIKRLVKGEGTYLILSNGTSIPVSRQQKDRLMERFDWV